MNIVLIMLSKIDPTKFAEIHKHKPSPDERLNL